MISVFLKFFFKKHVHSTEKVTHSSDLIQYIENLNGLILLMNICRTEIYMLSVLLNT